jgi:3-deoxy-D-manno-octulosonic-acid transferase
MRFLYTLGVYLYVFLIWLSALFGNTKAKKWLNGRKDILKRYTLIFSEETPWTFIWIHVSSLGEFEQGRPFIESVKKSHPNQKILLTFFSPSGYEIQKFYEYADIIMYLPIDDTSVMNKLVNIVRPKAVFFIKYDFWYNLLNVLNIRSIPVFFISCVFRKHQIHFWWFSFWIRRHLRNIETIFVQNHESELLLQRNGLFNVEFVGDTRVDSVLEMKEHVKKYELIEQFIQDKGVLILGSSWSLDEELLSKYLETNDAIVVIIAPHDISEHRLTTIEKIVNEQTVRYSRLQNQKDKCRVLILDTIGDLSSIYQYADVVHIGNGFGKGIHNILEPVVFYKPVVFGPNFKHFPEAVTLVDMGGAFAIKNFSDYKQILDELFQHPQFREKASIHCKEYIEQNQGATKIIIDRVSDYLWNEYPTYL